MIDWKIRLKNKTFWLALMSAVVLLSQQLGWADALPENIMDITNTVLLIATILGVIVDPTTEGIGDKKELPSE